MQVPLRIEEIMATELQAYQLNVFQSNSPVFSELAIAAFDKTLAKFDFQSQDGLKKLMSHDGLEQFK